MRIIKLLPLCMLLFSCTVTNKTQGQALYETLSNYQLAQAATMGYKDSCEAGLLVDPDCKQVIVKLVKVDNEAKKIINQIDVNDLGATKNQAISASLLKLTQELNGYLLRSITDE